MKQPSTEMLSLLKYRMSAVAFGHLALKYSRSWEQTPSIEIFFDRELVIEGKATALTNGAIEAAIIHSRAILEFLGLSGNSQTKLRELVNRKSDDTGIEQFSMLTKVSIQNAVKPYQGSPDEAEAAFAYVVYLANKGLAHTVTSFTKNDQGNSLLEIAFRGIPTLVINSFYIPLNIEPPEYNPPSRVRPPD